MAECRPVARGGRAAARCLPWRHGDQRRDGAGQGCTRKTARSRRADRGETTGRRLDRQSRYCRPRLHQSDLEGTRLGGRAAHCFARGRSVWPQRGRRGREGQCRIRLGQSDRADACRPLPGRGVRRCAGESIGVRRLRRHPRILHQRCRRAGRRARALRIPALSRGARRRYRRDSGRAVSRRLSEAGG